MPPPKGGNQKFYWGDFIRGEGNLRRSDLDDSKQLSVNTELQLKLKST